VHVQAKRRPNFSSKNLPRWIASVFFFCGVALVASPAANFVGDILEAAKSDYKAGRLDASLTKLDQCDKAKAGSGESLDLRGSIALEQRKFDLALRAFTEAHKVEPALFGPRLHLGDLLLREKKYAEAAAAYEKLLPETNVLISNERLRYGLLIVALARHDETPAKSALDKIKFPTETPAYYCAQAAWEFSRANERAAKRWVATAHQMFKPEMLAWFARPLYEFGWLKEKPPPAF
jgi:tetratricopeptide (TPR) repeat protein